VDGGSHWIKLTGNLPTIAVRDLDIQRRENDLVLGTFGRGFYVLDDYTPLRMVDEAVLAREAVLFPVKPAWHYATRARLGGRTGRGSQGASYFAAENPPFGAVFTYYLHDKRMTRQERRHANEKEARAAGQPTPYPALDDLRAEDHEREPALHLVVRNLADEIVRRVPADRDRGIHRAHWDLRYPPSTPVKLTAPNERMPWEYPERGPLATPGVYSVTLEEEVEGATVVLAGPEPFDVLALDLATFAAPDPEATLAFRRKVGDLQRAVRGAIRAANDARDRIAHLRQAVVDTPANTADALADLQRIDERLTTALIALRGDKTLEKRNEPVPPSIRGRVEAIVRDQWRVTSPPTRTQQAQYAHAGEAFTTVLAELTELLESDLPAIEQRLEQAKAPWTPGRIPRWQPE
jgi:hypothetical protein